MMCNVEQGIPETLRYFQRHDTAVFLPAIMAVKI
jgi:hypothetical protein